MHKKTRQMLQVLCMSTDTELSKVCADLIYKRIPAIATNKVVGVLSEKYTDFMAAVLDGNLQEAINLATPENKELLENIDTFQMLQGLLICEDHYYGKLAAKILSGETTVKEEKEKGHGKFMNCVLSGDFHGALECADRKQHLALCMSTPPSLTFQVRSMVNYQRLHYIAHVSGITVEEVLNHIIKGYYEVTREDSVGEALNNKKQLPYNI